MALKASAHVFLFDLRSNVFGKIVTQSICKNQSSKVFVSNHPFIVLLNLALRGCKVEVLETSTTL